MEHRLLPPESPVWEAGEVSSIFFLVAGATRRADKWYPRETINNRKEMVW